MMSTAQLPGSASTSPSTGEICFLRTMSLGGCNCIPGLHVCLTSFLPFLASVTKGFLSTPGALAPGVDRKPFVTEAKRLPIHSRGQGSRSKSLCLLVTADRGLIQFAVPWSSSLLGCMITLVRAGELHTTTLRTIPIFFLPARFSKLLNFSRKFPRCVLDRGPGSVLYFDRWHMSTPKAQNGHWAVAWELGSGPRHAPN